MPPPIPPEFTGHKYLNLTSFRKNGSGIPTPLWFAEENGKLYIMTRSDSGKYKRIRNNPEVRNRPMHSARQDHRPRTPGPGSHPAI